MGRGLTPRTIRDTLTTAFAGFAPVAAAALAITGTSRGGPRTRPGWRRSIPLTAIGQLARAPAVRPARRGPRLRARAHRRPAASRSLAGLLSVRAVGWRTMAQEHGDRLTAVDASFLAQEGPASHMHVGAVMIFDGPAPAYDDLADHVRARLHLVPRFRQKLAFPPARDRPAAVDRRPELQPRVPRARHRAAGARLRGAAARARGARSTRRRSTAPSRCGRCGSCRGSRAAGSR